MPKKVIIIGAGMSGLSAGCYARMNGYDVEIYEAHNLPGGLCTSWKRGDYIFDGCIHWLLYSRPQSKTYRLWEELGAVQDRQLFDHDIFSSVVARDGRTLHWYTDAERLQDHLCGLAPQDESAIRELCHAIRKLGGFFIPIGKPVELMGWHDGMGMMLSILPYLKHLTKFDSMNMRQLAAHFKDPFLQSAVKNFLFDEKMPATAMLMTLAPMNRREAGYPIGGSLAFARSIEKRFQDLGGSVFYNTRVERVLERSGVACGVRLQDGSEVGADTVIAACDMRHTLFSLLDGSRVDPLHSELMESGRVYTPFVQVSFGVDMDFSADISCIGTSYEMEQPIGIGGSDSHYFLIKNYCYDPTLAPAGKSVVGSEASSEWSYWEPLLTDQAAYREEKERTLDVCRENIERIHPGFKEKIEVSDVATPHTFARYSGNWHGTYMTWMLDGDFQRQHPFIPKTVPGLSHFYLSSMWTKAPGGIPSGALVGRETVQLMCHKDGKRFTTDQP